ncbi:MAG: hypothetical protein HOE54_17035, partial [Gammaproteobacteria bacterium]|nr:hypothetical protein [Gammaproteobacteria bacterium]
MSTVQPTAADFEPVKVESDVEQISRPSLSYWQDAWVRLKKNTRAIVSLWIIILLTVFTLIGPFIWQVDPALQDLNQVSQSPSWPKSAVVVEAYSTWDGIRIDGYQSPDNYPEQVAAPTGFRAVGDATTQRVRLSWDAVAGADGYNIYRNNRQPQD